MASGKDIESDDGLGGVHKVREPRPAVPAYAPEETVPVRVARGSRAGEDHLVSDPDQLTRVEHTDPAPVVRPTKAHTPESQEKGPRTPDAPFQDARIAPGSASAWEASPPAEPKN